MSIRTICAFGVLSILATVAADPAEGFRCGANEQQALEDRLAADPAALERALEAKDELERAAVDFTGGARSTYTIPVVFHIIHNNGAENISDAQVMDAVRVMNEDFNNLNPATPNVHPEFLDLVADVGIEFQLARRDPEGNCTNGITRTVSSLTYEGDFAMTQLIQWPRNRYLNIWVGASANGAAGYTYYPMWLNDWPEADGIVVLHSYVGSIGTSSEYRSHVLTHEIGHWLNLMHCWGNSNDPGDPGNCSMDDGVIDTPLTRGWTSCSLNGTSCDGELDNVENYMEYSYCYKMFTTGQSDRMLTALNSSIAQRNELWSSSTLEATGLTEVPALCEATFMHGRTEICQGSSIQFTDMSFHSVTERTWTFPGGTPSSSTAISPVVTYDQPGVYPVILEVTDGTTTLVHEEEALVHVFADPGAPVPFVESFEEMVGLPGNGWWAKDHEEDGSFSITNTAAHSGEHSVMIANNGGMSGSMDELRSPSLDLSGASGLAVSFRYAFAQRNAANDDRLRVHFSIDCGVNWSLRKQLRASTDLTTAGPMSGVFTPSGPEEWALAVIDVPISTFYVSDLLMRFEFLSDGGNHLYIDDINIHGTPVGVNDNGTAQEHTTLLFPNPAHDEAELLMELLERTPVKVVLRDAVGREVDTVFEGMIGAGPHRMKIPLSHLSSGIYLVEVSNGGHRETLQLIKR